MSKKLLSASAALLAAVLAVAGNAGAVDKEKAVHTFGSKSPNGPIGGLVQDAAGNFYGVASDYSNCCGSVFELSPSGTGAYTFHLIYSFTGSGNDYRPTASLQIDAAGNLYGSTTGGNGEIYELSPNGTGEWTETVLAENFQSGGVSSMVRDASGNFFGTYASGGAFADGFVFEVTKSQGVWTFYDIWDFNGTDGSFPIGVAVDSAGNVYGVTNTGGTQNSQCDGGCGVVFELSPNGGLGSFTEQTLFNFDYANGTNPSAAPVLDAAGNIYGTAEGGGAGHNGVAFELVKNGSTWNYTVMHGFTNTSGDGRYPNAALTLAGGAVYGTTSEGGGSSNCTFGCGTTFELVPLNGKWKESILYDFTGKSDGEGPGPVFVDATGKVFGTAVGDGAGGGGVVYELLK